MGRQGRSKVSASNTISLYQADNQIILTSSSHRSRRDEVLERVRSIFGASAVATNTTVEVEEFQDYWDQLPSFQLADTFYKHQMKYIDPSDDPKTANFTVTSPEESRKNPSAAASSDQVP